MATQRNRGKFAAPQDSYRSLEGALGAAVRCSRLENGRSMGVWQVGRVYVVRYGSIRLDPAGGKFVAMVATPSKGAAPAALET